MTLTYMVSLKSSDATLMIFTVAEDHLSYYLHNILHQLYFVIKINLFLKRDFLLILPLILPL